MCLKYRFDVIIMEMDYFTLYLFNLFSKTSDVQKVPYIVPLHVTSGTSVNKAISSSSDFYISATNTICFVYIHIDVATNYIFPSRELFSQ